MGTKKLPATQVDDYTSNIIGDSPLNFDTSPVDNTNADMRYAVESAFNDRNLAMKTELNAKEIMALSKLEVYNNRFRSKVVANFIKHYKRHKVSFKRKGRSELLEMTRNMMLDLGQPKQDAFNIDSLLGKR